MSNKAPDVLIVDDEELARLRIRQYLTRTHPDMVIRDAEDGVDALTLIASRRPDIVFLDIEMPQLSGFDVLRQLPSRDFQIIFQTAYDQFAVAAFEESACDYLLKPYTDERLERALNKALKQRAGSRSDGHDPLAKLDSALLAGQSYLERFVVSVGKRSKVVEASEVIYILSEDHVTRLMLGRLDYVIDHSLNYLEEHLDPRRFVRIHRNSIVNLASVESVNRGERATVTLRGGQELPVSRERRSQLLRRLSGGKSD